MRKEEVEAGKFIELCHRSKSMAEASAALGLHFNTFKRIALKLGCYKPNKSGKGLKKNKSTETKLVDILNGKHPHYQTFKLKQKIIKDGLLEYHCSICKISEWQGQAISLELDHIDGNRCNHALNNLRLLCPNCHSQTHTFRSRNIKRKI
jgi:hypothetical protein